MKSLVRLNCWLWLEYIQKYNQIASSPSPAQRRVEGTCLWGWSWFIVLRSHVGLPERLVTILQLVSNSVAAIQVQMQWLTLIILLQFNLSICSIHTIYWIEFKTRKIGFKQKRLQNHTFVTLPYSLLITFHHRIFQIFWIHPKGVFSSLSHHWILLTKRLGKLFLKNIF